MLQKSTIFYYMVWFCYRNKKRRGWQQKSKPRLTVMTNETRSSLTGKEEDTYYKRRPTSQTNKKLKKPNNKVSVFSTPIHWIAPPSILDLFFFNKIEEIESSFFIDRCRSSSWGDPDPVLLVSVNFLFLFCSPVKICVYIVGVGDVGSCSWAGRFLLPSSSWVHRCTQD